jgi:type IV secretion system protein VirD4
MIACWQDLGQISRWFGKEGIQGFMGSAKARVFFGVRELETASLVSGMAGSQTLEFNDVPQQHETALERRKLLYGMMHGGDPNPALWEARRYHHLATHRTKQDRALFTPDEVLSMPRDRALFSFPDSICRGRFTQTSTPIFAVRKWPARICRTPTIRRRTRSRPWGVGVRAGLGS